MMQYLLFPHNNNNVISYDKTVSTNNYYDGENVQQSVEHILIL